VKDPSETMDIYIMPSSMVDVQQQAARKNGFLTAKTHKIPTQVASAVNKVLLIQFATTSVARRATHCILNAMLAAAIYSSG
jgi:hypothetical protein